MSANGPIADLADSLLTSFGAALATAEAGGGPAAPAHQFIAEGTPVADYCDILAVQIASVRTGLAGTPVLEPIRATTTIVVDFFIWILRCAAEVPDSGVPSADAISAVGRKLASDVWVLTSTVVKGVQDNTLLGICRTASITETKPVEAEGGATGMVMTLNVTL